MRLMKLDDSMPELDPNRDPEPELEVDIDPDANPEFDFDTEEGGAPPLPLSPLALFISAPLPLPLADPPTESSTEFSADGTLPLEALPGDLSLLGTGNEDKDIGMPTIGGGSSSSSVRV
jgi:hypothetical protein